MKITKISMATGVTHTREIDVTQEELDRWQAVDVPIQRIFPHLSEDDREFLLTGMTPQEWEDCFKEREELEKDLGPTKLYGDIEEDEEAAF